MIRLQEHVVGSWAFGLEDWAETIRSRRKPWNCKRIKAAINIFSLSVGSCALPSCGHTLEPRTNSFFCSDAVEMASLTAGVGPSLPRASSSAPWKQLTAPRSPAKRRHSLIIFVASGCLLSLFRRGTSISINRGVDLARAALYVAAEDDSLVSHSSVPLPVDPFIDRLDDLSLGFCSHFESTYRSSLLKLLNSVEDYLYVKKGFHRSNARGLLEPRALYLHSVLTHRSGSVTMLSLLYSEILKMLRLWGIVNFDAEIFFPHDSESLPRGYDNRKGKEVDQQHVMTSLALLFQMLTDLKTTFWPFQSKCSESLFLSAANAANCGDQSGIGEASMFQLASTKVAHHRMERGIWTGVRQGDMRSAIAACERLTLLDVDPRELRDYAILLYHCGFYEQQALQYLQFTLEEERWNLPIICGGLLIIVPSTPTSMC
ncbi:hypothetical protein MLD38_038228 [Melastoma candidum]|uniref:Uncharacterized protein n=1 Tax=Melastoma candidum TaxID=119954 RepID=A0ACB9KZ94_9MYRT|nr:hypothetical protein MLD38_038228 [Melastoma candidum]